MKLDLSSRARGTGALLFLILIGAGVTDAAPRPQQRIPRQAAPTTAAIEGIVHTDEGLGLGGVAVVLQELSNGKSFPVTTTGDGAFRFMNLPPGRYQLKATRDGYDAFARGEIQLAAGEVMPLEFNMKALPVPTDGYRNLPAPGIGPIPPPPQTDGEPLSPYRNLPSEPPPETTGEPRPYPPLPSDDKIFEEIPNRWSYHFPQEYHRYNNFEVPYIQGHWYDPFNRNKFKGDYPIIGNRTFLELTAASDTFFDARRIPVPSGLGAQNPDSAEFFGKFRQYFLSQNFTLSADLFRGDTSFRPADWRIKFTADVNVNYLAVQENGIVNFDVRKGDTRLDAHAGVQEAFFEYKLKDLSNQYDFVSARAGIQHFNSDFRGFIFSDEEPGLRIFGNFDNNRYQYNAAYFAMLEKDSNSGLNSFSYRHQQVIIGNVYRQDFFKPGYTIQASFHYDKDDPDFKYDTNNFLVRPQAIGVVKTHRVEAYYYGLAGDGHIGRLNINHAFYQVLGHDSFNTLAGKKTDINAQMAAVELSLDKDWLRYRLSFFYASGDSKPRDGTARGFDTIFDNPNFNGGIFSFWNREGLRLTDTGVALVNGGSLVADLRSSKIEGQPNFVNPGIFMYNAATDVLLTPKIKLVFNQNLIRFARTEPFELLDFQAPIHHGVGSDSGIGVIYRPPLSENIVITGGVNSFVPFQGFRELMSNRTLFSAFANVRFRF